MRAGFKLQPWSSDEIETITKINHFFSEMRQNWKMSSSQPPALPFLLLKRRRGIENLLEYSKPAE